MVDKIYTIILIILVAAWLIYLLVESFIKLKESKKPEPKKDGLIKYDHSKHWTYSNDVDEDEFVDYEIVE